MDPMGGFHRPELDPAQVKKALWIGRIFLVVLVLAIVLFAAAVPYTNFLWFQHDARHLEVLETAYFARSTLLFGSFIVAWAVLWLSLGRAFRTSVIYFGTPEKTREVVANHALTWLTERGAGLVRFVAPVVALLFALGFAGEWNTLLLARHAQSFGTTDPTFGMDIGFFVFSLPWLRALANALFSLLFVTSLATLAIYGSVQALAMLARVELGRPAIRIHLHLLGAATLFAAAWMTWLKRYEVGLVDGPHFTGAGYAGMQALGAQTIFAFALVVVGLGCLINARVGPAYRVVQLGGAGLAIWYALGIMIYPEIVQRFVVDPQFLEREAPFAKQAISASRFAYGLDKVDVRDITPTSAPTAQEVEKASATLDNMRLWDPRVLREALDGLQGIRPYYSFRDVDIDRYTVDGKPTLTMLAVRGMNLEGLGPSAQVWTNQRLLYTHGYGVVVARVDAAEPDGRPILPARDIPQVGQAPFTVNEPRIYYDDARDPAGNIIDEYAIVATGEPEFDYPTSTTSVTHKWQGDRGIPIGGLLARLAFGAVLGDGNLIVSPRITGSSRLLLHRSVKDRCARIYPFLQFDDDPYVVLDQGRVVWILDAYTTTDMVPYAEHAGTLNYLRNSVKVVVDAYTGETTAYAVQPDEPVLKAYRAIYPGLVNDVSAMPAGLRDHWRYPEDLLKMQSALLAKYHVTDPAVFLGNGDLWEIGTQRGLEGNKETIRPFYVELQLPDEPKAGFVQILPFAPRGKPNMIGWLAGHGDADRYGRLTLYRLSQGTPISGPEQMEASFSATPEISNINRQFNNEQSKVVVGNLLVVPVGRSFLYAESLFLQAKTTGLQAVPRLTKVILAHNDRVVVADTYREALARLFGEEAAVPSSPVPTPAAGSPMSMVREALGLLDRADAALRAGDFAGYGRLQKQARDRLRAIAK